MTFKNLLRKKKIIIFDGAMGTMLQRENLPQGVCPETYNLTHPQIIKKIHQAYIDAGAQVIIANTFGANRLKLRGYGLEADQEKLISAGVRIAREAAKGTGILVAGDISILGELLAPLGKVSFSEAVDLFAEQAWLLKHSGCDCLIIETMTDLQEMRAAIIGSKKAGLPIIASMTFEKDLRTVTGTDPVTAAIVMQSLDADVIGANCSAGPQELLAVAEKMTSVAKVPVIIQPNAGLPRLENGKTVFPLEAAEFASFTAAFAKLGVSFLGGCCGTTPEHIKMLKAGSLKLKVKTKDKSDKTYLTSRTKTVEIGEYPVIIGERINPTARKALAEAIKSGNFSLASEEARSQVSAGCDLLDVNVSVPGTNEKESIRKLVFDLSSQIDKPLVLDSPNPEVIEEGLKQFPGKALVNSVTGEKAKLKKLLPLVKQYGAAVIGLCIDEKGIPKTWQKRVEIAGKIIKETDNCGIPRSDVFIDCLTLALSAEPGGIMDTIRAITEIKKKYAVKTVLGVSNVSHGLPNRSLVNATFLGIAVAAGLDAVIMNPLDAKMQETLLAAAYISGKDANGQKYLSAFSGQRSEDSQKNKADTSLRSAIIMGDKDGILALTEQLLAGARALDIINLEIIPALEEVGIKYENREYFLPQLMMAAECAQVAMKRLRQELAKDSSAGSPKQATIVFATVKGDVHDIGKNIVIAILQNYGYKIVDLGKDVPQGKIIAAVKKHRAEVVALSALMTTTMVEMPAIIKALKQAGLKVKTVIGGAVVTGEYAASIGADAYAKDAVEAARVIKQLIAGSS
ncbi:MAG: homocysteine S-methyltransferase family protein [bacterium]|nr:homocysteine S-methyltransferase family protein [bacterium]